MGRVDLAHNDRYSIRCTPGALFLKDPRVWDDLVGRAYGKSIFLTSSWLLSWISVAPDEDTHTVSVYCDDYLIGASVFVDGGRSVGFGGQGFADYADVLIDSSLSSQQQLEVLTGILQLAAKIKTNIAMVRLPVDSRTYLSLSEIEGFHITETARVKAPRLDMQNVSEVLKKKSIVRHSRKLSRQGLVECKTTCSPFETHQLLEDFFAQHVARWAETPYPSLFLDPRRRAFYRALTDNLGDALRFSTVRLDGRLIAAHFGASYGGTFTWYKPSFDPKYSKLSPGEVLLRHLFEQARDEGADYFDFTIGDEPFKRRFASETREVVSLHVTRSSLSSLNRRIRLRASKLLKR